VNFLENFVNARNVSTPLIKVSTPDAASTIATIIKSLGKSYATTPFATWDAINGLKGINDKGVESIQHMLTNKSVESDATTQLPIALQVMNDGTQADFVCFLHNIHLFWADPLVLQGVWNLRDLYKANGMLLVMGTTLGTVCPSELNSDVLSLEDALPTRKGIRAIVRDLYMSVFGPHSKERPTDPAFEPTESEYEQIGDALVGIAAFPVDQATAMNLNKASRKINIKGLWERKREIVKATPGLSFFDGELTLDDMGGGENIKKYLSAIMRGKRGANVILRIDEIEKAFAGAGTDTSGVKGDLLGNFLTWTQDRGVFCILLLGVPGASKSHCIYCLGGSFGKPVINFDIAGMQDSLVGNSGKNLRTAEATVEAISDGQIILMATANSLRGLPAELLSRFEKGGIFFFDTPDATERAEIMRLKINKFNLTPEQYAVIPDTTGYTGREIESMCDKADRLDVTLTEASQYVVPLTRSQSGVIDELRQSANERYLSSSKPGLYKYTAPTITHTPTVNTTGRKLR
jgi:hypothetical protein